MCLRGIPLMPSYICQYTLIPPDLRSYNSIFIPFHVWIREGDSLRRNGDFITNVDLSPMCERGKSKSECGGLILFCFFLVMNTRGVIGINYTRESQMISFMEN